MRLLVAQGPEAETLREFIATSRLPVRTTSFSLSFVFVCWYKSDRMTLTAS